MSPNMCLGCPRSIHRSPLPLATFCRACGADARCAPICPWLPYTAPAALMLAALPPAPGYLMPRLRRYCSLRSHLPLATLCRACGADARCAPICPWLPYAAPAALLLAALALAPGYLIPRLRRYCSLRSHLPLATLYRA